MKRKIGTLLTAIICLVLGIWIVPSYWARDETLQSILDQNSADKIDAQQEISNTPHPDFPPPTFNDVLERAERGEANAQYMLGQRYYYGDGVIQDREKSVEWQTRAANQGHATAQYVLGLMYTASEGVHHDANKAVGWISRSAEQGLAEAQYALAMMYQKGEDVPRDPGKASELLLKAAAQGNEGAQKQISESKAQE